MTAPPPSLLDRLLAPDDQPLAGIEALRQSVSRDLQSLLNARRSWRAVPRRLSRSIRGYGLPDFTAGAYNSAEQKRALLESIRAAIEAFEPRLRNVEVRLRQAPSSLDPVFRFVIAGVLRADDATLRVTFNTVVEAASTDIMVDGADD